MDVTIVTASAASADNLTDRDYRDIYDELRAKASLDQFVALIGSQVTKAWWSKYEHQKAHLNRNRKAELRRAVGLPALPLVVPEATATIDPDARVWRVGAELANRVVLIGSDAPATLTLRLNGDLATADPAVESHVTAVTGTKRARSYRSLSVSAATYQRLAEARLAQNQTWDECLAALLDAQP